MINGLTATPLTRYAWLSIGAALVTIGLKALAYWLTGSVSLLSDALESLVNLVAAVLALWVLHVAAQPPDDEHAYGHTKAEYFSSGVEGALILLAAYSIGATAFARLAAPAPIRAPEPGLALSLIATLINFGVARVLLQAARQHGSVTLEADGRHLMVDVWTSIGMLLGIGAVLATGLLWLDPLIALIMAVNIVISGARLLGGSVRGLMDAALPAAEQETIRAVLERHCRNGVTYHALRTRRAAQRRFVSVHVLVPGRWTVMAGHQLLEAIERDLSAALPPITTFTHLEPLEDPASFADTELDRGALQDTETG